MINAGCPRSSRRLRGLPGSAAGGTLISSMSGLTFRRHFAWNRRAGLALVSGAVHGSNGVEISLAGDCGHITESRSWQQSRVQTAASCAFLLTPVDVVTRHIGFRIHVPGEIDVRWRRSLARNKDGKKSRRSGRRENVPHRDRHKIRVARLNLRARIFDDAANQILVSRARLRLRVFVSDRLALANSRQMRRPLVLVLDRERHRLGCRFLNETLTT